MNMTEAINQLARDGEETMRALTAAKIEAVDSREAVKAATTRAEEAKIALRRAESLAFPLRTKMTRLNHLALGLCAEMVNSGAHSWNLPPKLCTHRYKITCADCGGAFCGVHGRITTGKYPYPTHNCHEVRTFLASVALRAEGAK